MPNRPLDDDTQAQVQEMGRVIQPFLLLYVTTALLAAHVQRSGWPSPSDVAEAKRLAMGLLKDL